MHREADELTNGGAGAAGGISLEEEQEEGEAAKRAIDKAAEDAVEEQKALRVAEEDKKALGLSKERVSDLEVRENELRNVYLEVSLSVTSC